MPPRGDQQVETIAAGAVGVVIVIALRKANCLLPLVLHPGRLGCGSQVKAFNASCVLCDIGILFR